MERVIEAEVDADGQIGEQYRNETDTNLELAETSAGTQDEKLLLEGTSAGTPDDSDDSSNNSIEMNNLMTNLFQMDLDEILQKIFLGLSPRSLHLCRQVCQPWNDFIKRRIWHSPYGRDQMLKKLENQWRHGEPRETVVFHGRQPAYLAGDDIHGRQPAYLAGDDDVLVCGFENGKAEVYRLDRWQMDDGQKESAVLQCSERGRAVQVHVGGEVIVTVDGGGMVAVWRKNDFTQLYKSYHHGQTKVLGVKAVKNLILTGGNDGQIALLKYEGGQVHMMKKITDKTRKPINHLDSDGIWALTGHAGTVKLWSLEDVARDAGGLAGLEEGARDARGPGGLEEGALLAGGPAGLEKGALVAGEHVGLEKGALVANSDGDSEEGALVITIESGHVFCCALDYPLAATTGLTVSLGVALWDMEKGTCVRRLNPSLSMWVVQVQGHHLAASMGRSTSPSIFMYDLRELASTQLTTDQLWSRQLECPPNAQPHFYKNNSRLFINQKDGFKILDFWNVVDEKPGPFKKYFISGIKSAFKALSRLSSES